MAHCSSFFIDILLEFISLQTFFSLDCEILTNKYSLLVTSASSGEEGGKGMVECEYLLSFY